MREAYLCSLEWVEAKNANVSNSAGFSSTIHSSTLFSWVSLSQLARLEKKKHYYIGQLTVAYEI